MLPSNLSSLAASGAEGAARPAPAEAQRGPDISVEEDDTGESTGAPATTAKLSDSPGGAEGVAAGVGPAAE